MYEYCMLGIVGPWIEAESVPVVQQDFEEMLSQKANRTGHHPVQNGNECTKVRCNHR